MVKIPSRLEDLLPLSAFERVLDALHRPELSQKVKEAISRVGLKEMNPMEQVQEAWQQARSWLGTLAEGDSRVGSQLINATGALCLSSSDGIPMASMVGLSYARAASGFLDRQHCLQRSSEIVPRCLGAKHHLWLSAPLLALHVACRVLAPKGVLIPRADCVRIPGIGDLYSILTHFGTAVTEVGAANGASHLDWLSAMQDVTGKAVVTTSLNCMPIAQASQCRQQLMETARSQRIPVIELLVDGCADRKSSQQYGFPLIVDRISQPDHLTLLPTHLLLGGTPGVLCMGDNAAVQGMQRLSEVLGAELSGPAIAANLLALQLASLDDDIERGMIGMLRANPENLRNRCQRMATQIAGVGPVLSAEVVESKHPLGQSPWDRYELANPVVRLNMSGDAITVCETLKAGQNEIPAIDVKHSQDLLLIDLRFVHPEDDHRIVSAFQNLAT